MIFNASFHSLYNYLMDAQEVPILPEKMEQEPQCLFQITEQDDSINPRQAYFLVKIVVTKQMRNGMQDIERNKKQRLLKYQLKEKLPQHLAFKEKYLSIFRNFDQNQKLVEEQRRKNNGNNEVNRTLLQYENYQKNKQRYNFSLFQPFENRGKSPYIKFAYHNQGEKYVTIRINKYYLLHQLNMSRRDLFNIAISFTRTWQMDFHGMIRTLWRIYTQSQKQLTSDFSIKSLDVISVSFDVHYLDKRIYRFRYSPFQFRTSPIFKEDNNLMGYNQSLSCVTESGNNFKSTALDSEFYMAPRLFIFDDLTDSNLFHKILNRSNLVYQAYSISRGTHIIQGLEVEQFYKKCLGQFYFSTTRLKKFMFTWSFKQFPKPFDALKQGKQGILKLDYIRDLKQVILNIPIYLQRDHTPTAQPFYKLRLQILETSKVMTAAVKEDIAFRIKEWYLLIKDIILIRDRNFFELEKQNLNRKAYDMSSRPDNEDYQIYIQFNSRDRFDRFFVGLLLIISTALDRHYFTLAYEKDRKKEDSKFIVLQTQQTSFNNPKKQYLYIHHFLKLTFKHTYLSYMFHNLIREEEKVALASFFASGRPNQYRLKCGQWKLQKIMKVKKKINNKQKTDLGDEQDEVLNFPEDFRRYIGILLRHFPLRLIYKDILSFFQSVVSVCYLPQQEDIKLKLNGLENILRQIINALLNHYYYCQFREKEQKLKQREREREKDKERERQREKEKDKDKEDKNNGNTMKQQNKPRPQIKLQNDISKRQRIEDSFSRVIVFKILKKSLGFIPEDKLLFEVTFRLMQLKNIWQTRIKQGLIVIRVFQDRIEFQREFNITNQLRGDPRKRGFDENSIKAALQTCLSDSKITITV